jgi:hypothetical protein
MGAPTFWDSQEKAQAHIAKLNGLKRAVLPVVAFQKKVDDLGVMLELVEAASPAEKEAYEHELETSVIAMVAELDELEIASFLTGQFDRNNAIFSIQSGAGGTESNDWADMLFRMYNRWAERRGFTVELQDVQAGEQAGITKATMLIKGENAYGYAKAERGVHRLVRISPFDSNARRHTSFAAADVSRDQRGDHHRGPRHRHPRRCLSFFRQGWPGSQYHRLGRAYHALADRPCGRLPERAFANQEQGQRDERPQGPPLREEAGRAARRDGPLLRREG